MVYGTYNYSYWGFINQLITGGPHIVGVVLCGGLEGGKISEIQGNIGLSEEEINGNIPESLGGRVEQRNLLCWLGIVLSQVMLRPD